MDDLDRYLEFELRLMLNPVVRARVPRRRGGKGGRPQLTIVERSEMHPMRQSGRLQAVPVIAEPAVAPRLALIS